MYFVIHLKFVVPHTVFHLIKLSSKSSTFETTHFKHLSLTPLLYTLILNLSKSQINLNLSVLAQKNVTSQMLLSTYEFMAQDGSTFHTHRNHNLPYCPKEPASFP